MLGTELPMRATTSAWGLLGRCLLQTRWLPLPSREEDGLGPHPCGGQGLKWSLFSLLERQMWLKSQLWQTSFSQFLFPCQKKKNAENQILNDNKYLFSPQYCLGKSRASNPVILKVLRVMGKWGFPAEADPCLGWAGSVLRGLMGYMTPRGCDPQKNRDPRVKEWDPNQPGACSYWL